MSNSEGATGVTDRTIYWIGTEDEQQRERMKACRARRKQYGATLCFDKDGSCDECEYDMALALRVKREDFAKHKWEYGHD